MYYLFFMIVFQTEFLTSLSDVLPPPIDQFNLKRKEQYVCTPDLKDTVMSKRHVMRSLMTSHLWMFFWWTERCWETNTGGFSNSLCWTVKPGSRQYFFRLSTNEYVCMWVCVSGPVCMHVFLCYCYNLYGVILCAGGLNKPTTLFPVWGTLRVFIKIIVTSSDMLVLKAIFCHISCRVVSWLQNT